MQILYHTQGQQSTAITGISAFFTVLFEQGPVLFIGYKMVLKHLFDDSDFYSML